ncbi:MAG: NAD-dependent epimerase/dehydratase family protein [Burkholderiaceae bacterium]|nr:NAD-dependent epimerase/dehydratase family protein [Burkholderiaceae bacterium]
MHEKTLLLAGAGDLAQRTAAIMQDQGFRVWGLRRNPPTDSSSTIQWVAADLSQPDSLTALPRHFSHVLFAAAPDGRSPQQYQTLFGDGLNALLNHLDLDVLQRWVFVSSTAVYGPSDDWVDEDTPALPQGFNGKILLAAEQVLHARLPGKAVILQPSGLYGPGRVQLLERLRQGKAAIPQPAAPHDGKPSGTTSIAWANRFHITDAARACAHLLTLDNPQPCYIGTDDHPWPIEQLYSQLAGLLGAPAPAISSTPGASPGKRLSNARLRASGFDLLWPDAIAGYKALIQT